MLLFDLIVCVCLYFEIDKNVFNLRALFLEHYFVQYPASANPISLIVYSDIFLIKQILIKTVI